jgi:hypothetical protein
VPGFLINGSASPPLAGQYKEGEDGKYGEYKLIFTSADDPSAKPYEYTIFVAAKKLDASHSSGTALQKLEVVRMPLQTVYDKGEPFNPYGMAVVAWHGSDTAGTTIKEGGVPLLVPLFQLDSSALLTATHGQSPTIGVSYTDGLGNTKTTSFKVLLQIAEHEILAPEANGVKFTVDRFAPTGAFVTLGITVSENYELEEDGIFIKLYDKENVYISEYGGVLSEIAPHPFTRKVAFIMPRNKIEISAKTLQIGSGLGKLAYKIDNDEKPMPGFSSESRLLAYNLAIPSTVATSGTSLSILAGPLESRPETSVTTIQVSGPGISSTSITYNDDNAGNDPLEVNLGELQPGSHNFQIQVNYQMEAGAAGSVRNYTLQVMKFADGQDSHITYEYTGIYQVFVPPMAGYYRIEAWGAKGGNTTPLETAVGGKGGYAAGTIFLDQNSTDANKKMPLYIYVGEAGKNWDAAKPYLPSAGGWNGGGNGGESASFGGSGGGGATSISTVAGSWNDLVVLANRILVAGGGGGATAANKNSNMSTLIAPLVVGNTGGGIAGSPAITANGRKYGAYKSYTSDGTPWTFPPASVYTPGQAQPLAEDPTFGFSGQGFGQGGTGLPAYQPNTRQGDGYNGKGGGGGGWWGGRVSLYYGSNEFGTNSGAGGGGGSNFISGHTGCHAITTISTSFNITAGENIIEITSSTSTSKYSASASQPIAGSPPLGTVSFTDTAMNAHQTDSEADNYYEPLNDDPNLNDGHGRVVITYLGME